MGCGWDQFEENKSELISRRLPKHMQPAVDKNWDCAEELSSPSDHSAPWGAASTKLPAPLGDALSEPCACRSIISGKYTLYTAYIYGNYAAQTHAANTYRKHTRCKQTAHICIRRLHTAMYTASIYAVFIGRKQLCVRLYVQCTCSPYCEPRSILCIF